METTFNLNSYELQTIAARELIMHPQRRYHAQKIA